MVNRRRIARANLSIALGDTRTRSEKRRIVRKFFVHFALVIADSILATRLNSENLDEHVRVDPDSIERVRKAFDQGRGAVGVFYHFGNSEVMGAAYGLLGLPPLTFIAQRLSNPLIDRYLNDIRAKHGNRVAYRDVVAAHILPALRRDELIGIMVDRNTYEGIDVDLFGVPARTTPAPGLLAVKFGCPIIPAFCVPDEEGCYSIDFGPIIEARPDQPIESEVHHITRQIHAVLEERVRERPELWLLGHRRWKCRPTRDRGPFPSYSQYTPPHPLFVGTPNQEILPADLHQYQEEDSSELKAPLTLLR